MVGYRRNFLPGGTFFFTVTLANRRSHLLIDHIDLLRQAFHLIRQRRMFDVDALIILPDHLHTIWTLPPGDADYPGRWRAIKSAFVRALRRRDVPLIPDGRGGYRLWQRRYWEHTIRDEEDLRRHVDYIHFNPVKHGLVKHVIEWPYSSFHRYVRSGWLPPDWGATLGPSGGGTYGE